jgi:aspartyl protease family protein
VCPICGRRSRRWRTARRAIVTTLGAAVLAAAVGTVGLVVTRSKSERPVDYGDHARDIFRLEQALEGEPCDRTKNLQMADLLGIVGDHRRVLVEADRFFKRCGPFSQLRWKTYAAHRDLSENAEAIADATLLIQDNPGDPDFWWWRGIIYERMGKLDEAARDYEKCITIEPRIGNIPFNLATVYEKLGRPCDGIRALETFRDTHRAAEDRVAALQRIVHLTELGHCADKDPP